MMLVGDVYVTVAEAAELLKVSRSTLWRWIEQGKLPAYRLGQRRVLIKRDDLEKIITPARWERGETVLMKERERLSRPLTDREHQEALAALVAARKLKAQMLERREGKPFEDSVEIIRTMREERMRELG